MTKPRCYRFTLVPSATFHSIQSFIYDGHIVRATLKGCDSVNPFSCSLILCRTLRLRSTPNGMTWPRTLRASHLGYNELLLSLSQQNQRGYLGVASSPVRNETYREPFKMPTQTHHEMLSKRESSYVTGWNSDVIATAQCCHL